MNVREELKSEWLVLAVAICCMLIAFSGPAYCAPFLYRSVIEEFGWTREQATLLVSVKYMTGAVAAIIIGRIIDLTGVKKMLIAVTLCGGIAMLSFKWTSSLTTYYLSGFLLGISTPGTMVAVKVLISRTFNHAQGSAMGLTLMGASAGQILVPLILATLIADYGWRNAFPLLGSGIWFIALPVMYFGLNEKILKEDKVKPSKENQSEDVPELNMSDLWREKRFWLILLVLSMVGLVDQAMIQHTNLYLELDLGFEPKTVAWSLSFLGVAGIVARLIWGITFDKLSVRGISIGYLFLSVSLLLAIPIAGLGMLALFATFRGMGHAAVLMDSPIFAKHCYGNGNLGLLIGIFTAVISVGFAIGPWLMGRMYTIYDSYVPSFILFAGIAFICAVLTFFIEPSYWLKIKHEQNNGEPLPQQA
jgi:predicted MFS family arabinose efflux permease